MPQKVEGRPYDSADLMEVMKNTGGWAQGWDDVLWYLEHVAGHNNELSLLDVPALAADVEALKRRHEKFSTDYRVMYQEITAVPCQLCPPPDPGHMLRVHLRHLANKWLDGLLFPATPDEVRERARANHAPAEIMQLLKRLEEPAYHNMGALLQKASDLARHRER